MTMYTKNGEVVEVVKKIEEGYLAKIISENFFYEDEDGESFQECISDEISFFAELFEKPLTVKLATEVKDLKKEKEKIEDEIRLLKNQKSEESSLLNKIAKFPVLQCLADYLTEQYNYVLDLKYFKVEKANSSYNSQRIKIVNTSMYGWNIFKLKGEYYDSNDDSPFMPFKTMEELNAFAKERLIAKVKKDSSNYNKSHNLKMWFNDISSTCQMKNDADFLAVYNSKMNEYLAEEKVDKERQLQEEIRKIEIKKKELEALNNNK